MEYLVIAVATAFSFIVLKIKFENGRYGDFILDLAAFSILAVMFGGTLGGLMIAMISSAIISVYLLYNPPRVKLW